MRHKFDQENGDTVPTWAEELASIKQEKGKRTRKFAENIIEWELSPDLLPVRSRPSRMGVLWYVNGSATPKSFVYVLKDRYTNAIRYVGLTDDPPRRHMEHRRKNVLYKQFTMVVVAVGGPVEESEWIDRCLAEDCALLNVVGNQ